VDLAIAMFDRRGVVEPRVLLRHATHGDVPGTIDHRRRLMSRAGIAAEIDGDIDSAVAVYTDDVIHDVVGSPTGPVTGPDGATGFYQYLTSNVRTLKMEETQAWYGDDFCVLEHLAHCTVRGGPVRGVRRGPWGEHLMTAGLLLPTLHLDGHRGHPERRKRCRPILVSGSPGAWRRGTPTR
jgi:hypothetical protein